MDLLSVMAHELGHIVLGMDESPASNDVMSEALPLGVRRMPTPDDLGLRPSAAWLRSHTSAGLKEPVEPTFPVGFATAVFPGGIVFSTGWYATRAPVPQETMSTVWPLFPIDASLVRVPSSALRTAVDELFTAHAKGSEPAMPSGSFVDAELNFLTEECTG
jgi:hypothetical protein